jgi:hypothetical protein
MEPRIQLPSSKQPAIRPHREPAKSTSRHHTLLEINFNIIFPSVSVSFECLSTDDVPLKYSIYLSSFLCVPHKQYISLFLILLHTRHLFVYLLVIDYLVTMSMPMTILLKNIGRLENNEL